jgi:hypothetical protein
VNTYGYVGADPIIYIDPWGLCWQFSQSTGQWSYFDDSTGVATPVGPGWSGQGAGYNNPAMEYSEGVGPLPAGLYWIGSAQQWHGMPDVMPLTPIISFQFGRPGGFKIHGAFKNPAMRPYSSEGCPIAGAELRKKIKKSSDRCLGVVE